ncbi:nucleotide sugar dehydrogenase [Xylariaceae sp. AK1471]|nr:nucleotide sugar dehydrogenase [Xylariaceae sp. AK1471]
MTSTAPTTPDGRLSFSPVLRPERQTDSSDHVSLSLQPSSLTESGNGSLSGLLESRLSVRNICCIGAGYVGGPTAAVIAYQNPHIRVTVVDKDEQRIRRWNSKHLPIYEPDLGDIVRIARDGTRQFAFVNETSTSDEMMEVPARQPNLFFSVEVEKCIGEADLVLIAVNTPTKMSGAGAGCATDMTAFEAVTNEIAQHARAGTIIVEKSTVPCLTAQLVQDTISVYRPGAHFEVLSNPEFLAAGTAVQDLMHPDRILIGSSRTPSGCRAANALADLYAAWVPRERIITTNVWSSELSKLVANSMLAQRISSINSISAICEKTGAEIDEIAAAIGCDARIGDKFLKAGIGFSGSCFKKDILSLVYLADSLGLQEVSEYWRQVIKMNEYQRDRFSQRVIRCLNNTLVGKKITFFGYTFKANTSDTRESPTLEIIKTLLDENPKEIAIYDPCCNPAVVRRETKMLLQNQDALREDGVPIVVYSNAYQACAASNAVLITTECDEFRNTRSHAQSFPGYRSRKYFDPRPFPQFEVTETDILALHKLLLCASPALVHNTRYKEEPCCAEDCPDCELIMSSGYSTAGNASDHRAGENVDWHKISYSMKKPKWLFDGKGIIDPKEMAKLDIYVESIGRQGRV